MSLDFNNWKTNGELLYEMRQFQSDAQLATFTLLYNQEGMIFTDNRTDEEIKKMIFGLNPGFRYYYKKSNSNFLFSVEKLESGEDKVTKFKYDSDWNITKETKNINGFVCYKATRMPSPDSKEEIEKEFPIIAWYTPEIPLPYGPFLYGGLPGMILELQRENVIFFKVKAMRWNEGNKNNDVKIQFPKE